MAEAEAVRLAAALAQCEIALVRRDAVAGPLLAQAARAAEGTAAASLVQAAAALARVPTPTAATRKACQALCRAALQAVQAELLTAAPR